MSISAFLSTPGVLWARDLSIRTAEVPFPLVPQALFACCAGPLAWSIPALRNSLVLHDLEKTTSVFMHW